MIPTYRVRYSWREKVPKRAIAIDSLLMKTQAVFLDVLSKKIFHSGSEHRTYCYSSTIHNLQNPCDRLDETEDQCQYNGSYCKPEGIKLVTVALVV